MRAHLSNNGKLMGVIQLLNKKVGTAESSPHEELGFVQEISPRSSVWRFFNQERYARRRRRTRFDYLISHDLLKEDELDSGLGRVTGKQRRPMEELPDARKHNISAKKTSGESFEEFYHCKFVLFNDKMPIPGDLLKNLKKEYLRRELVGAH